MLLFVEAVAVGAAVGLLAGALGIGGGILAIPVLVYLLGQDPHAATAESLVIVIITSAAALPSRFKHHQVRLGIGVLFGLCSAVGAIGGSYLNAYVPSNAVMYAFSALLAVVAVVMLRNALLARRKENAALATGVTLAEHEAGEEADDVAFSWSRLPLMLALGTVTGVMVGFFGIGGGFMMIPVLMLALKFSIRTAAGTSFIVITVTSLISLASRLGTHVEFDPLVALLFAIGSGAGAAIGSPLSNRARPSTLTFIFVVLLIAVAIYTLVATLLGL